MSLFQKRPAGASRKKRGFPIGWRSAFARMPERPLFDGLPAFHCQPFLEWSCFKNKMLYSEKTHELSPPASFCSRRFPSAGQTAHTQARAGHSNL